MDQSTSTPDAKCPECGAQQVDGMSCWDQLGALLAWEYKDAELSAEHFLTVACYNLQHPARFEDDALVFLRSGLIERLDHGITPEELRRRASSIYEGNKRVLKRKAVAQPVMRHWSMTINDVYTPEEPEGAARRVRAWAASIRNEM